jgi:hypothetical protein
MIKLHSSGGKATDMDRKLEETRQMNKKNYQMHVSGRKKREKVRRMRRQLHARLGMLRKKFTLNP